MLATIARLSRDLVEFVYPSRCLICGNESTSARTHLLCEICLDTLAVQPLPNHEQLHASLDAVFAGWHFDAAMQKVIHALKYRRRQSLSRVFSHTLGERLRNALRDEIPRALLMPVPLHPRRQRERGFNQSLLLAAHLAEAWNIAVTSKILKRTRFTQSQAQLGADERLQNVHGAFAATPHPLLSSHTIFLIDDVFTTGATMQAGATALKSAGATRVIGIALAKAL